MSRPLVMLGGAVCLVGFGIWIGRSSSEPARVEAAPVAPVAVVEPPAPPPPPRALARVAPRPSLPAPKTGVTLPGLTADLVDSDPKIRRAAITEVASTPDPDVQTLLVASRDHDGDVAATAIVALGKQYAEGRVTTADMLARAADRSLGRARSMALNAVGTVPHPDTARMLAELLRSSDVIERRTAAALLAFQDPADAIPLLVGVLGDSDKYVRGNALASLRSRSRGRDFGFDAGAWQSWWQAQRR